MTADLAIAPTPDGWEWQRLTELCLGVFDCPHSTPKLAESGPYLARTQDILSGVFRYETAARVSDESYRERVARAEPRFGDLLYSREGTYFGIAAEVPKGVPVCLGQRMVLIRPDSELVDHHFLRYWLNSGPVSNYVHAHKDGSVAQRLNLPTIRGLPVPLPSIDEQRGIAATLGALDDKIESNLRAIDLTLQLLDALAAKAATDLSATSLGTLVTVSRNTINPTQLGDEIVDHYSLPAFDEGARPEHVPASTIMSNKLAIPKRSILLSRLNPRFNRTWWVIPDAGVRALASTEFLCLTASDDEALAAVWLAVRDEYFRSELPRRVTGTSGSHQRVRPDDALAIEVPDVAKLPEKTKRAALAALESIEQNRHEIARLTKLRDTLLPELLSGHIRVPEADKTTDQEVVA